MCLVGLDIGTTGCKAVVFDPEGNIKGQGFMEYDVICKKPGWAEQDAEDVWNTAKLVMREAVVKSGVKDIKAVSVSVQGDAVIPVDKNIKPLHNSLLGMDYRSLQQSRMCEKLFGARELFKSTGMRPHPMNSLTKILWFKDNLPDVYGKTYKFMTYEDFILARLGSDEPVIDYSMASRTMAFDLEARTWSKAILAKLNVDESNLSKPVHSACIVGTINADVAEETGICKGAFIVTGGHDQTCAALGAGAAKENIAVDSHGTAEVLSVAFNNPKLNDLMFESFYPCYYHVKKDMYFTFSLNHTGGILLKWYRDNLGCAEAEEAQRTGMSAYQVIESKVSKEPSSVMVLPHFNGSGTPWCDLDSKGAILGLTMASTRHDIVKGIFDSLAYELRVNIETLRSAGVPIEEMRCVGGGARSPLWLQIKADITQCRVATLKVREAACLGAALLAGVGIGAYSDFEEAVGNTVSIAEVYESNEVKSKIYDEKYKVYKDIYFALKDVNRRI